MNRNIFWKELAFTIIVLFVGTSMTPLANSLCSQQSISTDSSNETSIKNNYIERKEELKAPLSGLAPPTKRPPTQMTAGKTQPTLPGSRGDFYAFNAYDPNGMQPGPVTFGFDAVVNLIAPHPEGNFISGSDFDFPWDWYAVCYYGGLFQVDSFTGDMTFIASTIPCDSLVLDTTTAIWYVASDNALYTMDITTGATTLVGFFGIGTYMISLMVDSEGNMYGYDVLFGGNSHLYSISKTTGVASVVGDMGHDFCYAQEGKFDRSSDILYLAAYDIGMGQSYLATCDPETAAVTIINQFSPWGIQIDGLGIPGYTLIPGVGVKKINAPVSGNAGVITPEVTVENYGWDDEYSVPVNMKIWKNQYIGYLNEHFDGMFPPAGWSNVATTDFWVQSPDYYAGGAPPEAVLWYYNNYGGTGGLQSPYFNTTSALSLKLSFRSCIYWQGGPCNCTVEVTGDGGLTWNDVSPWTNPIVCSQGNRYTIDISAYIGTQTGVRFIYSGQYSWLYFWAIDDVIMVDQIPEYNQTFYVDIPAFQTLNVTLPDWTPADLNVSDDVTLEYVVNATTQYYGNARPNFYKQKTFTLYFGYFHDVAITAINSPQSGLALTQPCQVVLENHGLNAESVNVSMQIGKIQYSQWTQEESTEWQQSNSNAAGGTAPEACLPYYSITGDYAYLMSCPIDTSALPTLTLSFRSMINNYAGGYNCSVKSRSSEADPWADVSPWVNPISASLPAAQYTIVITGDISTTTQVMFEFSGYYFNLNYWYVDDFVCGTYSTDFSGNFPPVQISTISEYDQTTTVEIATGTTMNVSLPEWTPTDLPFATTIDYLINASVSMNVSDENPANNQLIKIITLNYEHDVGVIEIITEPEIPWKNLGSITVSDYVLNISGIVQNFGVTYTEVDIPVNAQITKDLIVIYDETVIIPGLLAPGATATVTFPPASIPYEEGDFKLSMQTQLVGDDHPNNNKKIKTWGFVPPDQTPPVTTANITGTMGQNGWYISKPIVTLTAVDPDGKWPSGVNATYIKIDNGAWEVYTVPVTIQGDGTHTVQYYSDDKAGNVEDIHTAPTFKVDTTAPTWNTYTFTAQNAMKNKWLCEADVTDATSGVVLVEFYVDDALVNSTTVAPYTFLFEGKPTNNSQALAYDAAGNSAFSPIAQYYEMNYQTQQFFQQKDL